jgi:hypothetical protein
VPPPALPPELRSRLLLSGGLAAVMIVAFVTATLVYPRVRGTRTAAVGPGPTTTAVQTSAGVTDSPAPTTGTLSPTATRRASTAPTSSRGPDDPRIVFFRINQQVKCPQGNSPGRPLVLEWHAAGGVTRMALSIDNPGRVGGYKTYDGPDGSDSFSNFGCAPPPGTTETHTFTIYTVGGGAQKSKTLTITATSNSLETATPTSSPTSAPAP